MNTASIGQDKIVLSVCPTSYAFVETPGKIKVWDAPDVGRVGVYLWCLEYEGAFLVNYVGKAGGQGGFASRLWQEDLDYQRGLYCSRVEIELWKRGIRRLLPSPELTRHDPHLQLQLREIRPAIRVLLIPLSSDGEARKVESTLICHFRDHPSKEVRQFIANRDQKNHKPKVEFELAQGSPKIIGLSVPVPYSLEKALESMQD